MKEDKRRIILYIIGIALIIASTAAAAAGTVLKGDIILGLSEYKETDADEMLVSVEDEIELTLSENESINFSEDEELIVNINTASEDELMKILPGVGEKRAAAIVEYRNIAGGFNSVDELCEVEGLGEGTVRTIKQFCTLEGPSVQRISKEDETNAERND